MDHLARVIPPGPGRRVRVRYSFACLSLEVESGTKKARRFGGLGMRKSSRYWPARLIDGQTCRWRTRVTAHKLAAAAATFTSASRLCPRSDVWFRCSRKPRLRLPDCDRHRWPGRFQHRFPVTGTVGAFPLHRRLDSGNHCHWSLRSLETVDLGQERFPADTEIIGTCKRCGIASGRRGEFQRERCLRPRSFSALAGHQPSP